MLHESAEATFVLLLHEAILVPLLHVSQERNEPKLEGPVVYAHTHIRSFPYDMLLSFGVCHSIKHRTVWSFFCLLFFGFLLF